MFTSYRDGNPEIYAMNDDGTDQRRLTNSGAWGEIAPAWSPDGTKIAFARDRHMHVMNVDGTNETVLGDSIGGVIAWSPDGTRIAFTGDLYPWQIYVMNADGTNPTRFTNNPAWDDNLAWGPPK